MINIKSKELLKYFIFIVIGYTIAKIYSCRCEYFNVGGQNHDDYDYISISDIPDNTCLKYPEKIKEFMDSCVIISDNYGERMSDCDSCGNAVNEYFDINKCNDPNTKRVYRESLLNLCKTRR
tara:strand:+ start:449 stop:814 length:366 start_codon:yes stop_codon:yes gene_type:complete